MPQTVIHVADDGRSAKVRSRMMQQLSFGGRPSLGAAIYENEAVKENGVWKFSKVHAFNTWTASYDGGWARNPGRRMPGAERDLSAGRASVVPLRDVPDRLRHSVPLFESGEYEDFRRR